MNWFERNLVHSQINKKNHAQDDTLNHGMNSVNEAANAATKPSLTNNKFIAFKTEAREKNAIHLTDKVVSQQPTIKPQSSPTTVIAVTKPPIHSEETTTQYAPAWKSLINKIVNSNKNDLAEMNPVRSVDKAWSTVIAKLRATTNSMPTKTTIAPVQQQQQPPPPQPQGSSKFCMKFYNFCTDLVAI